MAKFSATHSQTGISTEMNSLAAGASVAGTTVVDNTINLDPWGALNATFVFATGPAAGTLIDVYRVPEYDGTNYDTVDANSLPQTALYVGSFVLPSTATTQHLTLDNLTLTPNKWKYSVKNNTAVAFSTGSSIVLYSWQTQ